VHFKRWITGLIALPFLILAVSSGGILFLLLIGFACMCSLWEYFRIVFNAEPEILSNLIIWWGFAIGLAMIGAAHFVDLSSLLILIATNLVGIGVLSIFQFKSKPAVMEIISRQIQGIIYIPLLLAFLVMLRRDADGMVWIFLLLGIIFAGDISAYYVGSHLGRHKLAPSISPGKTFEGAVGGLAGNLLVGSIGKFFFLPDLNWGFSICFFLATGIAGQVGDLFESELKRVSRIKDSGGILPGHGGFLDRIDALLFASPVAYFFKVVIF
jgi:phosphatidate cytidylyltransferase